MTLRLAWTTLFALAVPSFFILERDTDQAAFRRWFVYLSEIQAFQAQPSTDVTDCAGLVRFAYRESFRKHDSEWASRLGLPLVPPYPPIRKWVFPYTPLKANIFRTGPGPDSWGEFADARTLREFNTYLVSRDVRRALPGDLLFYRQLFHAMPFHVMVFVGTSQIEPNFTHTSWVVYHTGPGGHGEIRRVRLEDLLRHPSPQWRPDVGNANFLGVYRWNILPGGTAQ